MAVEEARSEGRPGGGHADEVVKEAAAVEEAAPVRLGTILNAADADEWNEWLAFEAGADTRPLLSST